MQAIHTIILLILLNINLFGQVDFAVKPIKLYSVNNDTILYSINKSYSIICFFSYYCKPCIKELNEINSVIQQWRNEFDIDIIAVSSKVEMVDFKKFQKFAQKKSYLFPLYIDFNNEMTEYLYNIEGIKKENYFRYYRETITALKPQLFILDSKGSVIMQKRGYSNGDYLKIYSFLKSRKNEK